MPGVLGEVVAAADDEPLWLSHLDGNDRAAAMATVAGTAMTEPAVMIQRGP